MPISVQCPNPACRQALNVPEQYLGKTGRCPRCKTTFRMTAAPAASPAGAAPAAADETHAAGAASTADDTSVAKPAAPAGAAQMIGRFQVRARLGSGAFGTVYRAYDPQLEREVALKVPNPGVLDSPRRIERFLREAKAAARLRHPNIVPVYDAGRDGAVHYIAAAFVEGRPLAEAVPEGGMEFERAARLAEELAGALAYAHGLGVVHRDVKPANVMLDAEDRPHLMDFGLAALDQRGSPSGDGPPAGAEAPVAAEAPNGAAAGAAPAALTQEGAVLGTPAYMAPEQAAGQQGEARPASDQYSLGVVLYELLTGRVPFEGPAAVVLYNTMHTEPPAPRSLRKEIPLDLETICQKAMAKRPEDRYADCQEMADDLRRWQEGEPIKARRLGLVERVVRWAKREPKLAAAGAVTAASLAAVAVLLGLLASRLSTALAGEKKETVRARQEGEEARASLVAEKEGHERTRIDLYFHLIHQAVIRIEGDDLAGALRILFACPEHLRGWEWDHLRLRAEGALVARVLRGHPRGVINAAFSADSLRLAVLMQDGSVRVWDLQTGYEVRTVHLLKGAVPWGVGLALGGNGTRLAVGWNQGNGPAMVPAPGGPPGAPPPAVPPGEVRVFDVATGKQLLAVKGPPNRQVWLALDRDGRHLAVARAEFGKPAEVKLWDVDEGRETGGLEQPVDGLRTLLFRPDGGRLVTGTSGQRMEYRPVAEKHVREVNGKKEWYETTRMVCVVVGSGPARLQLWDAATGKEVLAFDDVPGEVQHLTFCPDGRRLAGYSGGMQKVLKQVSVTVPVTVPEQRTRKVPYKVQEKRVIDGKVVTVDRTQYREVVETANRTEYRTETRNVEEQGPGGDGKVRVWDAETGKVAVALDRPALVTALAFSPDCDRLAVAGSDPCDRAGVTLWDLRARRQLLALPEPAEDRANQLAYSILRFSPDGRHLAAAAMYSVNVTVWSAVGGRLVLNYDGHRGGVCGVAISPDGRQAATYSACNQTARLWELRTGKEALAVPNTGVPLTFSRDGKWLVGGCYGMGGGSCYGLGAGCFGLAGGAGCYGVGGYGAYGGYYTPGIKLWERATGRQVLPQKETDRVLAVSPDGSRFAAIRGPDTGAAAAPAKASPVTVRELATGREVCTLAGLAEPIGRLVFSPDGSRLACVRSSWDARRGPMTEVRLYDAETGREVLTHADAAGAFAFSPDGSRLASARAMAMPRPMTVMPRAPGEPVAAPPPMAPARPPEVVIWDTRTGKVLFTLRVPAGPGQGGGVGQLAFSPDGKALVAAGPDQAVRAWEVGGDWRLLLTHAGAAPIIAFSPDGGRLVTVTAGPGGVPQRMGAPVPTEARTEVGRPAVASSAGSGDPRRARAREPRRTVDPRRALVLATPVETEDAEPPVVVAAQEPILKEPPMALPAPEGFVQPMPGPPAFAPAPAAFEIKVWDLRTGKELWTLRGHTSPISTVAFSADGSRLASANWHAAKAGAAGLATVKVWDMAQGRELLTIAGHGGRVNCMAFTPDGRLLVTASDDQSVRVWDLEHVPEPLPDRAAAEWVLRMGGNVGVDPDGRPQQYVDRLENLPAGPFRLVWAHLGGNKQVDDAALARLRGLTALAELALHDVPVRGPGLANLVEGGSLARLYLNNVPLDDAGMEQVARLPGLTDLRIENAPVTDAGLEHLKGATGLTQLNLAGTRVTDAGLEHLRALTQLQGLTLDRTAVTGSGLRHLAGLPLGHLGLAGTKVSDAGLAAVEGLTGLYSLHLGGTAITDAGLARLRPLTNLSSLFLDGTKVSGPGLAHLQRARNLAVLYLQGTPLRDAGLAHLAGHGRLSELYLDGAPVTDAGLVHLKDLRMLQQLRLVGTKVTDQGLENLKGLTRLMNLWLDDTAVTGAGLKRLAGLNIGMLSLAGTRVTDADLAGLKALPRLREVYVGRTAVTGTGAARLRRERPGVTVGR